MDLLDAFATGKVAGAQPVERTIRTLLSAVLLGETEAYKVYTKKDNYFGAFSDPAFRDRFYEEDFLWNRLASPEIYLELCTVREQDGRLVPASPERATDRFIRMRRVEGDRTLRQELLDGKRADWPAVFLSLRRAHERISAARRAALEETRPWRELYAQRIDDIEAFLQGQVPEELARRAMAALRSHLARSAYLQEFARLQASIDCHSGNIVLLEDGPAWMDVYLVKSRWHFIDPAYDAARLLADAHAYGDQGEAANACVQESFSRPPEDVLASYTLSGALIMAGMHAHQKEAALAQRFFPLIEELTAALERNI